MQSYQEDVDENIKYCGDLSRFFRTNVYRSFPEYKTSNEDRVWDLNREWLLEANLPNDKEQYELFRKYITQARTAF